MLGKSTRLRPSAFAAITPCRCSPARNFVGHVDPKVDRPARRLHGMSRAVKRGHELAVSVGNLARWLGLK